MLSFKIDESNVDESNDNDTLQQSLETNNKNPHHSTDSRIETHLNPTIHCVTTEIKTPESNEPHPEIPQQNIPKNYDEPPPLTPQQRAALKELNLPQNDIK